MKSRLILVITGAVLAAAFLGGCEITVTSVTGGVVDARSGALAGIAAVEVTFTKVDGGFTQTETSSSSGSYSMSYTGAGLYKVTASKSGWFFIPQTVYVGGWLQKVPDILGIKLDEDFANTSISFILTWNDSYKDIDGRLTFPDGNGSGYEGDHDPAFWNTFQSPYEPLPGNLGFGPNTTLNRESIFGTSVGSSNSVSGVIGGVIKNDGPAITLDRDEVNGRGPEVITLRCIPNWLSPLESPTYGIAGTDENRLPTTTNWTWVGVMEYYIDGWNATYVSPDGLAPGPRGTGDAHLISSQDGGGADAVLHIVQGSTLLGAYRVPEYANIRTASVVRINLFIGQNGSTWLQFVPDIKIIDYNNGMGILSAQGSPAPVFGVFGAARQ